MSEMTVNRAVVSGNASFVAVLNCVRERLCTIRCEVPEGLKQDVSVLSGKSPTM